MADAVAELEDACAVFIGFLLESLTDVVVVRDAAVAETVVATGSLPGEAFKTKKKLHDLLSNDRFKDKVLLS